MTVSRHESFHVAFRFGIEAEFLLVDAETSRPLWHKDLQFSTLNGAFETIDTSDLPPLDGLDLEAPHRKCMPYIVEGYHVPGPDQIPIDILPKGAEIRTPVCRSIEECVECLKTLHDRLADALLPLGYRLASLSHHPTESFFHGPKNKRRHDFWQWAMEVMTTYGPDINISLPSELNSRLDIQELHAKVNYYGPAMAAFSLASPLCEGGLWTIRGTVGKSMRTYRRSAIAPAIELHPEEQGRMEFKLFEATPRLADYHAYLLLWLTVLLSDELPGRATDQTRIYDLGQVARYGLAAETVSDRAGQLLDAAASTLPRFGFDAAPLVQFGTRLQQQRVPADDIIDGIRREGRCEPVLRKLIGLVPEQAAVLS